MKKNLINKLLVGALVIASIAPLTGGVSAYAAESTKDVLTGWQYKSSTDGKDGKWYYYNGNGEMLKNMTITEGNKKYQLGEDGAWVLTEADKKEMAEQAAKNEAAYKAYLAKYPETNECSEEYKNRDNRWSKENGNWYFNWKENSNDKNIKDDWEVINGFWYHFDKDGVMEKNVTIKDGANNDCVLNEDGVLTNREEPDFGDIDVEGHVKYTKKTENGNDYYVNDKGEKKIGWVIDETDKRWHYTNEHGIAQKNTTVTVNGFDYKLDENGAWVG